MNKKTVILSLLKIPIAIDYMVWGMNKFKYITFIRNKCLLFKTKNLFTEQSQHFTAIYTFFSVTINLNMIKTNKMRKKRITLSH